jgi:hypothetical protein
MSSDMPLNAWADKDGIEPPDLGLTSQPQSPPPHYEQLGRPVSVPEGKWHTFQPQSPPAGDELDDLINHLVIRQGNGPNGSGGEMRYWKNDVDISAKSALNAYILAEVLQLIKLDLTGAEIVEYAKLCMGDYPGDRTLQFIEAKQRKAATARFGAPADKLQGRYE